MPRTPIAILADVHGNLESLRAVLDDIAAHDVHDIYCLGDMVGYGPNPRECVDLLADCRMALLGNHELAALGHQSVPMTGLPNADLWTSRELAQPTPDDASAQRRRDFLEGLPRTHREDEFLFLHGSPRNPVHEYLFPEDIHNVRKMQRVFALVDRYCFMGHTHVPGIFTEDSLFIRPDQADHQWRLSGDKTLCNVGSVGQSRDGNWRACYVLLDGHVIHFRRVDYDIDTTFRKIRDRDDFPAG